MYLNYACMLSEINYCIVLYTTFCCYVLKMPPDEIPVWPTDCQRHHDLSQRGELGGAADRPQHRQPVPAAPPQGSAARRRWINQWWVDVGNVLSTRITYLQESIHWCMDVSIHFYTVNFLKPSMWLFEKKTVFAIFSKFNNLYNARLAVNETVSFCRVHLNHLIMACDILGYGHAN